MSKVTITKEALDESVKRVELARPRPRKRRPKLA